MPECGKATSSSVFNEVWDVVIVGAGPAGSTAAIYLSAQGHRVLLLDKDAFPRDKICGDGLIADAIRALKKIGLYEEISKLGYETASSTVYSASRIRVDVKGHFLTLERFTLDDLILRKAIAAGANFWQGKVINIESQLNGLVHLYVAGESGPIRSRITLVATGANIELPVKLRLVTRPGPSAVALRCYIHSSAVIDRLIISYDRSIIPGYAWIFPLGNNKYNVGCGLFYNAGTNKRINLRSTFHQFVTHFPLAADLMKNATSITPLQGAMLRCGLEGSKAIGSEKILLIGETIGSTFPFTGEGIGKAMETAELAAEIAHQALASGDSSRLSDFTNRLDRELRPKFLGYQIAEKWLSKPWLNDFIARRIRRSEFLQESVAGILNETVDPRDIFSLRGILSSFIR